MEPLLWQMILLPKQTPAFPHPLYTYTHTHEHTQISLADSAQWHDCICSIKQTSANRPAELIVTQYWGTQTLSRVQPPTHFAMQRESADEVCQHASLTPNSQKTTGNRQAPVCGWQGIEEKTLFKIFRPNSSACTQHLNYFSSYYSK